MSRLRRLLGPFYVTGAFWYRFATLAPRVLPGWAFVPVTMAFGFFFYCALFNVRQALIHNLAVVLGACGYWKSRYRGLRSLINFSLCFGDRYERLARPDRFRVIVDNEDHWRDVSRGEGGIILVTAHIGAWDVLSQMAPSDLARRVHVVREEEIDPAAQEVMARFVREHGHSNCVTHFASDDLTLGLKLKEALDRGEIVALQGDRPRIGSRIVKVSLFGREVSLPAGPAALARLAGVPLVPVFCFREKHYLYRVAFRSPIRVSATGDRAAAIAAATRSLGREIEWAISERPYQWFALGRVWPDQPPESA